MRGRGGLGSIPRYPTEQGSQVSPKLAEEEKRMQAICQTCNERVYWYGGAGRKMPCTHRGACARPIPRGLPASARDRLTEQAESDCNGQLRLPTQYDREQFEV